MAPGPHCHARGGFGPAAGQLHAAPDGGDPGGKGGAGAVRQELPGGRDPGISSQRLFEGRGYPGEVGDSGEGYRAAGAHAGGYWAGHRGKAPAGGRRADEYALSHGVPAVQRPGGDAGQRPENCRYGGAYHLVWARETGGKPGLGSIGNIFI